VKPVHAFIYLIGTAVRSPLIFRDYLFLRRTCHWPLEQLKALQFRQLAQLIQRATRHSPFYRRKFQTVGFSSDHLQQLSDIKSLPILTKEELRQNLDEIHILQGKTRLIHSETSGSSGAPLVFWRSRSWDARVRAAQFRAFSWHGVRPWERNGYLWGYNLDPKETRKIRFLDRLQNRFRLFCYDEPSIEQFARKLSSAVYLEGYSSMIYEVAKTLNRQQPPLQYRLKMVKGTAEKIYPAYQEETQKAFGVPMISEYGSAEAGIIAFECPFGRMHITMENCIVEEEAGQILVTNLVSDTLPIIRYALGDTIELDKSQSSCPCGMAHPAIASILGRVGKTIYGRAKKYPSLTLYYVFKNLALKAQLSLNYQAIQVHKGALTLRIEQSLDPVASEALNRELRKYFSSDLEVTILSNSPPLRRQGKLSDFITLIKE
jgi:phenylacetate-CoA ligase